MATTKKATAEAFDKLELDEAVQALLDLKDQEEKLKERRQKIEAWMLAKASLPEDSEGAHKYKTDLYVVTITTKLSRTLDQERLDAALAACPDARSCVDFKPSLKLKEWRQSSDAVKAAIGTCIVTKPAKPAIAIKPVKEDN